MIGTFNNNIKQKMMSISNNLNSQVKVIQSGIQRSVTRQKNQILQEKQNKPQVTATQGGNIPVGGTEVEKHDKFREVLERGRSNPAAQKVYQYFSKFGDEVAKRAVVVSGLESGWRDNAAANLGANERSFGPFQINLNAHNQRVSKFSGSSDINANAKWLQNIDNSLKVAEDIYKEQGFKPWTVARKSVKTFKGTLGNKIMDL